MTCIFLKDFSLLITKQRYAICCVLPRGIGESNHYHLPVLFKDASSLLVLQIQCANHQCIEI